MRLGLAADRSGTNGVNRTWAEEYVRMRLGLAADRLYTNILRMRLGPAVRRLGRARERAPD